MNNEEVLIYTHSAFMYSYFQKELGVGHNRRSVTAGEYHKQYEHLRVRRCQGNPNFPLVSVTTVRCSCIFIIMRNEEKRSDNDDLSITVFSLVDQRKQVY